MRHSQTTIAVTIPSASTTKNQRCQPGSPASMLKAAPVLCNSAMLNTGSTLTVSNTCICEATNPLLIWSRTMTARESPSQRDLPGNFISWVSYEFTHFTGAGDIGYATGAETGMLGILVGIFPVVPAAHALLVGGS